MPKRNIPSGAKVKRLTLYPRQKYSFEEENSPEKPAGKPAMKHILTREKPETKGPEKIPHFRDIPPKYEVPAETGVVATDAAEQAFDWAVAIFVTFIIFVVILFIIFIPDPDGGGSDLRRESVGGGRCPTSCDSTVGVTVSSQCRCPSPCTKSFPITNPPEMRGYKQCYR